MKESYGKVEGINFESEKLVRNQIRLFGKLKSSQNHQLDSMLKTSKLP